MKKITLSDLNAPNIVFSNCYFWSPAKNARGRRNSEKQKATEIYNWLLILNQEYDLGLTISINADGSVDATKNGSEICYFHYRETCGNIYKKQNFKELLKIVQKKLEK